MLAYLPRYWVLTALLLVGCEDRYRYHCQNPKNWNDEDCKPPLCVATQTCPEYFSKPANVKPNN